MSKQKFAVFDIDGTLIRWQLYHAIVNALGKHGYISDRTHQDIHDARMRWKNRGTNDGFTAYEQVLVNAYLKALTSIRPAGYRAVVDEIYEEFKDQTYTYTRDLVRSLKEQGYLLFAISGSQQEIVEKVAAHHGFDAVVGAKFEVKAGKFTGSVDTPIFDKKAALNTLIQQFNVSHTDSYGVGDSMSDAPVLETVANPVAFNPDRALFTQARERGWPIVVERKNVVYELQRGESSTYELKEPSRG